MIPDDRRYTRTHEWLRMEEGEAVVGLTAHAAEQLGDVTFVDLPAEGQAVKQGEPFGSVESVKAVSDLYAPVDGVVVAVNNALDAEPGLINASPYEEGWIVRISVADQAQASALAGAADYEAFLAEQEE